MQLFFPMHFKMA
jgi:hypothetical protein